MKFIYNHVLIGLFLKVPASDSVKKQVGQFADKLSIMSNKPLCYSLPQFHIFFVFRFMVTQSLVHFSVNSIRQGPVFLPDFRVCFDDVIDHGFALMRKENPQVGTKHLQTQCVNCLYVRHIITVRCSKTFLDILPQLFGDYAVEGDYKDIPARNCKPLMMENSLYPPNEAESFSRTGARFNSNDFVIAIDDGYYLSPSYIL